MPNKNVTTAEKKKCRDSFWVGVVAGVAAAVAVAALILRRTPKDPKKMNLDELKDHFYQALEAEDYRMAKVYNDLIKAKEKSHA